MKKIVQYVTIAVLGLSVFTSCKKSDDSTPTALASVGTNTTAGSVDAGTLTRTIYVTGLSGNIHEAKVRLQGSSAYTGDVQAYLKSPSGKILQLCASEAMNSNNSTYPTIDVTFSDAASTSVVDWKTVSSTYFSGTFRPRGSLSAGYSVTGTTTNLAGFKGESPNGTWTLYFSDDESIITSYFTSWELFLSTSN